METECQGRVVEDKNSEETGNSCSHLVKARETVRLEKVKKEVHLFVGKEQQEDEEKEEGLILEKGR